MDIKPLYVETTWTGFLQKAGLKENAVFSDEEIEAFKTSYNLKQHKHDKLRYGSLGLSIIAFIALGVRFYLGDYFHIIDSLLSLAGVSLFIVFAGFISIDTMDSVEYAMHVEQLIRFQSNINDLDKDLVDAIEKQYQRDICVFHSLAPKILIQSSRNNESIDKGLKIIKKYNDISLISRYTLITKDDTKPFFIELYGIVNSIKKL